MNEGWIKLHRKINENELITDTNASHVFLWLLVNVDRSTGKIKIGRFWLSKILKMNPSTLRDTIYRLRDKYKVCDIQTTTEFSEISLINWNKYQSSETKTTTRRQPDDTLQEERIENREYINTSSASFLLNLPKVVINGFTKKFNCAEFQVIGKGEELYNYCLAHKKKYSDYQAFMSNALRRDYGLRSAQPMAVDIIAQKEAELEAEGNLSFRPDYSKIGRKIN